MVLLYVRIRADPLVSKPDLAAVFAHPSHKFRGKRRIRFFSFSLGNDFRKALPSLCSAPEYTACAADRNAGKLISILGRIIPGNHGTHTVAEEEIRKIRIFFLHKKRKGMFIFHHCMASLISPVAPRTVFNCRLSMSHMVVCSNNITCIHKFHDHMQVSS